METGLIVNITSITLSWDNGGTLIIDASVYTIESHYNTNITSGEIIVDFTNDSVEDFYYKILKYCQDQIESDQSITVERGKRLLFGFSINNFLGPDLRKF